MYEQDLTLNNSQELICHKIQRNQTSSSVAMITSSCLLTLPSRLELQNTPTASQQRGKTPAPQRVSCI